MERRSSSRSPVTVSVYIPARGKTHQVCKTIDLSSRGVYLAADSSIFPVDAPISLYFAVRKHNGSVIQLHRMNAKVVRFGVRGGRAGLLPPSKNTGYPTENTGYRQRNEALSELLHPGNTRRDEK